MLYEVFINALLSAPSRLLGMEPIFDAAEAGKHGFDAGDDFARRQDHISQVPIDGFPPPRV